MFYFVNEQNWNMRARIIIKLVRFDGSRRSLHHGGHSPRPTPRRVRAPRRPSSMQRCSHASRVILRATAEEKAHRLTWGRRSKLLRALQKVPGDLCFEIERVIVRATMAPRATGSTSTSRLREGSAPKACLKTKTAGRNAGGFKTSHVGPRQPFEDAKPGIGNGGVSVSTDDDVIGGGTEAVIGSGRRSGREIPAMGSSVRRDLPSKKAPCSMAAGLMVDIAFDMARGLQQNPAAANGTEHMAADDALLGNDAAGDAGLLADHDVRAVNIALDLALDLNLAFRHEVAVDDEIGTNHRGGGRPTRPEEVVPSGAHLAGRGSMTAASELRQSVVSYRRLPASGIGAASLDLRCYAFCMREWIVASCVYIMKLTHAWSDLCPTSERPSGYFNA